MFENVRKFVRKRYMVDNCINARGKKVDNCLYAREKKVDFREMLYAQKIVVSNLDPITVDLIFLRPQC